MKQVLAFEVNGYLFSTLGEAKEYELRQKLRSITKRHPDEFFDVFCEDGEVQKKVFELLESTLNLSLLRDFTKLQLNIIRDALEEAVSNVDLSETVNARLRLGQETAYDEYNLEVLRLFEMFKKELESRKNQEEEDWF